MSSFSMDTPSMSSSTLVNSLVKKRLFKTTPYIDEPPFQVIHTMDLSLVDMTLRDSPDLVIHKTEIWAVWRPQVGCNRVWHFLTQQFNCCTCTVCRCTVLLEHKVGTRHSAYRWQQFLSQKHITIVRPVYFCILFNKKITRCGQV